MYIDPGTGSMLIQALIAAIPIIGAALIAFRKKIFKGKGKSNPETPPVESLANDDFEVVDDD